MIFHEFEIFGQKGTQYVLLKCLINWIAQIRGVNWADLENLISGRIEISGVGWEF